MGDLDRYSFYHPCLELMMVIRIAHFTMDIHEQHDLYHLIRNLPSTIHEEQSHEPSLSAACGEPSLCEVGDEDAGR